MFYSDEQIQYIMNQVKEYLWLKQVFGYEQRGGEDFFFKGLGYKGESYNFCFKPQTGTVFQDVTGAWKQVKGLMIKSFTTDHLARLLQ